MIFILPLLIGCVIGLVRGGSISNLAFLKLKRLWILPVAYAVQYTSIYYLRGLEYEFLILLSYLMLILFCLLNQLVAGVKIAAVGIFLNFLVMVTNHFRMPAYLPSVMRIDPKAALLLKQGLIGKSIAMSGSTHLNFLGDIFSVHIGRGSLISIGDILFSIGIAVLIQHAMRTEGTYTSNDDAN